MTGQHAKQSENVVGGGADCWWGDVANQGVGLTAVGVLTEDLLTTREPPWREQCN